MLDTERTGASVTVLDVTVTALVLAFETWTGCVLESAFEEAADDEAVDESPTWLTDAVVGDVMIVDVTPEEDSALWNKK